MKKFSYWQDYVQTINASTDLLGFDSTAAWVSVYAASEEFEISFDGAPWLKINQGLRIGVSDDLYSPVPVNIKIRSKQGAATFPNAITLRLGVGIYDDNRFAVSAPLQIAAGATLKVAPAARLDTPLQIAIPAGASTQIFPANANAKARVIRNTSAVDTVRISSTQAHATAARGKPIGPGEEYECRVSGALYGYSANAVTLEIAEESD